MSTNGITWNGYTFESQEAYNTLEKAGLLTEENLKLLDTNSDYTITEDDLVSLDELEDDTGETGETEDTEETKSSGYSDDEMLVYYMQRLEKLEQQRNQITATIANTDADGQDSLISQIDSVTSSISTLRKQIYNLLYSKEKKAAEAAEKAAKEAEEAAAAAAKAAEEEAAAATADSSTTQTAATSATTQTAATTQAAAASSTALNSASTSIGAAPATSGSYTYSASSQEFVNTFNNSSFTKGILNGQGALVASVAEKYDIDPCLFSAIVAFETGWGTSNAIKNYNNPGGMMSSSGLIHYSTLQEGLEAVAKNLKNNYIDQGLTTISAIGSKYCPVGASNDPNGLNSNWVPGITSIYNKLAGTSITSTTAIC